MTMTNEGASVPKSRLAPAPVAGSYVDFQLHVMHEQQTGRSSQVPLFTVRFQTPTLQLLGAFLDLKSYGLLYPGYEQPLMDAYECSGEFSIKYGHSYNADINKQDPYGFPWHYSYLGYTGLITQSYISVTSDYDVALMAMLAETGKQSSLIVIPDVRKP